MSCQRTDKRLHTQRMQTTIGLGQRSRDVLDESVCDCVFVIFLGISRLGARKAAPDRQSFGDGAGAGAAILGWACDTV